MQASYMYKHMYMMHVHVHICTFYTPTVYRTYTIIPNLQKVPETSVKFSLNMLRNTIIIAPSPTLLHLPWWKSPKPSALKIYVDISSHVMHCSTSGFHTGLLVEGGSLWGTAAVLCTSIQHTWVSVCARGMCPPRKLFFLDLLRLLLMQSETKLPAII